MVNKNMLPFDERKAMQTSGLRLGTPAVTTRGMKEDEMKTIAGMIDRVLRGAGNRETIEAVRGEVLSLCEQFPLYGCFTAAPARLFDRGSVCGEGCVRRPARHAGGPRGRAGGDRKGAGARGAEARRPAGRGDRTRLPRRHETLLGARSCGRITLRQAQGERGKAVAHGEPVEP